ncbi:MAG: glycosyltransferase family 39 protein [Candidatus Shapirobacteria bacterium]|nr:glycosyltransferase family 39 protein [Candidatus Shapirobacteria bacterium]
MLFKKKQIRISVFIFLSIILILTRFIKLDWGNGFFFHPDENRDALALSTMKPDNINPSNYAYGQFPLIVGFLSYRLIAHLPGFNGPVAPNFEQSIFILRTISAIASCLSVFFIYQISKYLFKNKISRYLLVITMIFTPGLIQLAHFGTNESILILIFTLNLFISFKILHKTNFKYILLAGLISGIGIATKISALIFTGPIFLSLLLNLIINKKFLNIIKNTGLFIITTVLFSIIFSPQFIFNQSDFKSSVEYEVLLSTGKNKIFYTDQFLNTTPYLFQIKNIFPYTNGIPVTVISLIGLVLIFKTKKYQNKYWQILLISSAVIFFYNGQLYTKWTRYISPIFFILPILSCFLFDFIKNKFFFCGLIILSILPGILFLRLYFQPDTRFTASEWIVDHIPAGSYVLSESNNVMGLPLLPSNLSVTDFDFYKLETDPDSTNELSRLLSESDYIFVPSRRVFKNRNNSNFPVANLYYQNLFSGQLGFTEIKKIENPPYLFLNSENAEETWSVFDHPTIRIYQKTSFYNQQYYQEILDISRHPIYDKQN